MQDIRHAFRLLIKSPAFTLIAVLSLALGIGANTAMFSIVNTVLLKALPIHQPEDVVLIGLFNPLVHLIHGTMAPGLPNTTVREMNTDSFGPTMYQSVRDHNPSLVGIGARGRTQVSFREGDLSERASAEVISGNFFDVLGVRPAIGRLIAREDDRTVGAHPVCVISHDFWIRRFGADRNIAGRVVQINNQSFTILGVTAESYRGFDLDSNAQVYVPLAMRNLFVPAAINANGNEIAWLHLVGRIEHGSSVEAARLALEATFRQLLTQEDGKPSQSRVVFADGSQGTGGIQRQNRTTLLLLMSGVAIVLLTACANVANLLLSRAAARRKEFAVRLAVGASRARLIRQLLTESLMLSLAGGLLGFVMSVWLHDVLGNMVLQGSDVTDSIHTVANVEVFLFSVTISIVVGLLFGLAPAFASTKPDVAPALKGTSDDSRVHRFSLRNGLVVFQVALSMVLLVGAGLLSRSLLNLRGANLGFVSEKLAVFSINPPDMGYKEASTTTFIEDLALRLEAVPGVRSVSYSNVSPLSGNMWMWSFSLPDRPYVRGSNQIAYTMHAGPGFFSTIGTPMISGREFTVRDRKGAPAVAIVNDYMARQFWPNENPIGQHITIAKQEVEIVGVSRDSKYQQITEKDHFTVYRPMLQTAPAEIIFHVRSAGDAHQIIATARQQVRELDPKMPIYGAMTMNEQIESGLLLPRMLSVLSSFFGGLALLLSGIGLYGVISYAVTRRTREIGIRMALGAQQTTVLRNVLVECALLAAAGVAIGIPAAIAASRFVRSYLFGLSPTDVPTYAAIGIALLLIGLLAGSIPARRATQVDPLIALRQD